MAKESEDGNGSKSFKLKLVHVVIVVVFFIIGGAVTAGKLIERQKIHGEQIDCNAKEKVEKEVFEIHVEEQREQIKGINNNINNGFNRIDKRLSDMAKE